MANALSALGVGPGDRVASMEVNCPQLIETYFAAACLDAIYVPLPFRAKNEETLYMVKSSEPKVMIVGARYLEMAWSLIDDVERYCHLVSLGGRLRTEVDDYEGLLSVASSCQVHFPEGDDADTTVLMFTAGTTGTPKGVMLSHESLTSYLLSNVTPPDPESCDSNLLPVPLYHIGGFQSALAAVYGGRTLVLMRQFEAKEWLELTHKERPTRSMLVPTMMKQIMDHPDFGSFDLSSLKVLTYGAATMSLQIIQRAIKTFPGVQFINAFGQTESAATIAMLSPDDHLLEGASEDVEMKLRRLGSIGRPLDGVDVRIVDECGNEVSQGDVGEIVARGPRIMKGYWGDTEYTEAIIRDGWLHTGDLAYQDKGGYIFLSGRAKDFIKRGGEMVSPEEVEQVLASHPVVDEAAVIGVPDLQWGEQVRAIVVRSYGSVSEEELMEYCHQRLASFKKPESVVFVKELPRNPLGKVLKRELRELYGSPAESSQ